MQETNKSNIKTGILIGIRPLIEAIEAQKDIDKIYLQKNLKGQLFKELWGYLKENNLPYTVVPKSRLDKFTRANHQGVLTHLSPVAFQNLSEIIQRAYEKGQDPFVVVLDRVSDVRNFGAIARTAEAAGAHALVIGQKNAAAVNEDAMKTSAGALNHLPLCREANLNDTLAQLKQNGLQVVGCTEKAQKLSFETKLSGPLALVMGSEDKGLASERQKLCDQLVKLPMLGKVGSLNVSVATGAILYEAVRQRQAG
jgi:23S rRNA (guanosine2251-2'-O)-methyltransferase